jgi:hypothetical protein
VKYLAFVEERGLARDALLYLDDIICSQRTGIFLLLRLERYCRRIPQGEGVQTNHPVGSYNTYRCIVPMFGSCVQFVRRLLDDIPR